MAKLETIAEGEAHARWIVENHVRVGLDEKRQRCALCEQWWPCDLVGLAALAVRKDEQLQIAAAALEAIVQWHDRGGDAQHPAWVTADDALTQMSVVE